ncbi:hypothetical protein NE237_032271 [Protea cynaroides]|uniref:Uncharacterized protein n=1 Tax=Protea cynaroides TaxID=273540 RepID=A0A9Q0R386_9MAGN|nr:hypothetical protein NE237_032271 [Protea cynaroides]
MKEASKSGRANERASILYSRDYGVGSSTALVNTNNRVNQRTREDEQFPNQNPNAQRMQGVSNFQVIQHAFAAFDEYNSLDSYSPERSSLENCMVFSKEGYVTISTDASLPLDSTNGGLGFAFTNGKAVRGSSLSQVQSTNHRGTVEVVVGQVMRTVQKHSVFDLINGRLVSALEKEGMPHEDLGRFIGLPKKVSRVTGGAGGGFTPMKETISVINHGCFSTKGLADIKQRGKDSSKAPEISLLTSPGFSASSCEP